MDKYNLGVIQSGFSKTVLYDGDPITTSTGTYALSDSVYNYKLIIVEHGLGSLNNTRKQSNVIVGIYNEPFSYSVSHGNSGLNCCSGFHFSNDGNNIIIDENSGENILKIVGIN